MRPIVIRAGQMSALKRDLEMRWLIEQLQTRYPAFAGLPQARREEEVQTGVAAASSFGLTSDEFLSFLSFEQTHGSGYWRRPEFDWALKILSDQAVSPDQKMRNLKNATIRLLLAEEDRLAEKERVREIEAAAAMEQAEGENA